MSAFHSPVKVMDRTDRRTNSAQCMLQSPVGRTASRVHEIYTAPRSRMNAGTGKAN